MSRKYAEETPLLGECPICTETRVVQMSPCSHVLCAVCVIKLEQGNPLENTVTCPQCRRDFHKDDMKAQTTWNLECSACLKLRPSEDFSWCQDCDRLFCFRCQQRNHPETNHFFRDWESGEPSQALAQSLLNCLEAGREKKDLREKVLQLLDPVVDEVVETMRNQMLLEEDAIGSLFPFDHEPQSKKKKLHKLDLEKTTELRLILSKLSGMDLSLVGMEPIALKSPKELANTIRASFKFGIKAPQEDVKENIPLLECSEEEESNQIEERAEENEDEEEENQREDGADRSDFFSENDENPNWNEPSLFESEENHGPDQFRYEENIMSHVMASLNEQEDESPNQSIAQNEENQGEEFYSSSLEQYEAKLTFLAQAFNRHRSTLHCRFQGCTRVHRPQMTSWSLDLHVTSHMTTNLWGCRRCDAEFSKESLAEKHALKKHRDRYLAKDLRAEKSAELMATLNTCYR